MTHYELLGITGGATIEEMHRAYETKMANAKPIEKRRLQSAYSVLCNPTAREMYDTSLETADDINRELEYRQFVERQEEYRLHDGSLMSRWVRLYRMEWHFMPALSTRNRYQKIAAEVFFRSLYGLCGVIIVFFFMLYAGGGKFLSLIFEVEGKWVRTAAYAIFAGVFVGSKYYGQVYREWRYRSRQD